MNVDMALSGCLIALMTGLFVTNQKPVNICLFFALVLPQQVSAETLSWSNITDKFNRQYLAFAPGSVDQDIVNIESSINHPWRIDPIIQVQASKSLDSDQSTGINLNQSVSQSFPTGTSLSLSSSESGRSVSSNSKVTAKTTTTGFSVKQELLKGGPFYSSSTWDKSRTESEISKLEIKIHKLVKFQLALDSFADAQSADRSLSAAKEALERATKQNQMVAEMVKSGYKAKADTLVTEAAALKSSLALEKARNSQAQSLRKLKTALFFNVGSPEIEINLDSPSKSLIEKLRNDQWPKKPLFVELSDLKLKLASSNYNLASRKDLPKLTLGYTVSKSKYHFESGDLLTESDPEVDKKISLSFSMPLVSGISRSSTQIARLKHHAAGLVYSEKQLESKISQTEIAEQMKISQRALEISERLKIMAEKSLSIEKQKYSDGKSTISELSQFQKDVDQAQLDVIFAQVSLLKKRIESARVTGHLFEVFR